MVKSRITSRTETPAVILGMDPTGLAVVRSLGRRGVRVIGVDGCPLAVGFSSRYCRQQVKLDPAQGGDELLKELLRRRSDFSQKPVILAVNDEALVFLARNCERLKEGFTFPRITPEILDQFLNKKKFYQLCSRHDIAIPRTFYPEKEGDLASAGEITGFPCIIKPIYTHLWAKQYGLKKVFLAETRDELTALYGKLTEGMKKNVLIQEVIPGSDEEVHIFAGYFDRRSRPLAVFTGRKLRQFPPRFGTTTYAESVWIPEVADLSQRLLTRIRFNGLCDVEFKRDHRDNGYKIMEINPRPGRWYSLVETSGVDLNYRAYLDLKGLDTEKGPAAEFRERKWMLLSRDVFSALIYIKRKELTVSGWLKSIVIPKDYATFAVDDPLPFLGYFLEMAYKAVRHLG